MTDIARDGTGDVTFVNGLMTLVTRKEELIQQQLSVRLYTNRGEWKFNIEFGLPWISPGKEFQILSKNDKDLVLSTVRSEILKQDGIEEILSLTMSLNKELRIAVIYGEARIISGDIVSLSLEV